MLWGYEDGSFQPKGDITRAEVAALIYRAVTGDVTDAQKDVYSAMTNDFSDVKDGQWFAGYVNFCANAKYVAGYGDGTFGPNDKVTGYQTLAMILRAIGYDHNGEFIGADWEIRTAAIAQDIGLLDNVKSEQLGQPASRELVAELIFQAMNASMVKWVSIYEGYRPLDKDRTSLGQKTFKLNEVEGVVIANEAVDLRNGNTSLDDGKTALRQTVDKKTVDTTYNLSTDISIIGEKVSVYVADKDAVSTPVSLADVDDYSNTTDKDVLEDLTDGMASNVAIYNNYKSEAKAATGMGTMVKAIDNTDDGKYDIVLTETEDLAVVKYVKTDGEIVLDTAASEDDQVVYSNPAVGDVVLTITYGGRTYIEEAAYVTGYISGYEIVKDAEDVATIGGNDYAVSDIGYVEKNAADVNPFVSVTDTYAAHNPNSTYNGTTYNYYQDAYGNIRAYEKADENAVQYGLILDYDHYKSGPWANELWVKYLTVDNEVKTAIVDNDEGNFWSDAHHRGDVVKYRLDADGEFVVVYCDDSYENDGFKAVDGIVGTVPSLDLAYAYDAEEEPSSASEVIYNVDEDFVAFYYSADGDYYGVLTGEEAIQDLALLDKSNFDLYKDMTQIDADAGSGDHSGRYGTLKMVNIDGVIDDLVGFAYVDSFNYFKSTTSVEEGVLYYYNAVNEKGEKIVLVSDFQLTGYADEQNLESDNGYVFAYNEQVIDGNKVNRLIPVEALGFTALYGDLHAVNDKLFQVYNEPYGTVSSNTSALEQIIGQIIGRAPQGIDMPAMFTLPVPEVYANVNGGTTSLSTEYCSTGWVVAYDIVIDGVGVKLATPAVFVTDVCDGDLDYVDVTDTYQGTDYDIHVAIGTALPEGLCYEVKFEGADKAVIVHDKDNPVITAAWDGAVITGIIDSENCETCTPPVNTALDRLDEVRLNGEKLDLAKGYGDPKDAIANATKVNLAAAADNYTLVVTTKVSNNAPTLTWGDVDWASTATAAQTLTFGPYGAISGTPIDLTGINTGSYVVIALENTGDVAYFAYVIG